MPRHKITNTFMKGMNQDKTWTKANPDSYRESANLRPVTDDMGSSTGALATVRGNKFNFEFPDVPNSYLITISDALKDSLNGEPATMTVSIDGTSFTFSYSANNAKAFYEQLANHINTSGYTNGVTAQHNDSGVAVYSSTYVELGVISGGTTSSGVASPLQQAILGEATSNLEAIGEVELRDSLIIFTTSDNGGSQIWEVSWNTLDEAELKLIRHANDNFSKDFDIEAKSRYETNTIQRVYWTDDYNDLRSINVKSSSTFLDKVDVKPSVKYSIPYPKAISQTGGTLPVGWYSYSYRQKNLGGSETSFSKWSAPFPINTSNEESDDYWEYTGSLEDEESTKALTVEIPDIDSSFSNIDVVCMYQKDLESAANYFYVVENIELAGSTDFEFVHSAVDSTKYIDEAELFIESTIFNRCKTITIKDNRLLAGNIKDDSSDANDFDAFAARYPANSNVTRGYDNTVDKTNPYNKDSNVDKTGSERRGLFDSEQHKYKKGTSILGGTGENIEYEFITKELKVDDYILSDTNPQGSAARVNIWKDESFIDSATVNNRTVQMGGYWNSFKNPFIACHFRGYMRSEVYRFGIVFFDKGGKALQVKWIDDIRMPEQKEVAAFKSDSTGTYAYSLGVKFNVTIPEAIKNRVSGFSIVRAERTKDDETIIGQGYMTDLGAKVMDTRTSLLQSPRNETFLRRVDRIIEYGGPAELRKEIKSLHTPKLLFKDRDRDLKGLKIRPIAAVSPASYAITNSGFNIGVDGNPGGSDKWRWTKFFNVPSLNYYYGDNDNVDNFKNTSAEIEESYFLLGQSSDRPTKNINNPFFLYDGISGLVNFAAPFGSDDNFNNIAVSGTNQQQFRARGGYAHIVKVDPLKNRDQYYSSPNSLSQTSNSRILSSSYYSGFFQNGNPRWWIGEAQRRMTFNLYRELSAQYGGASKNDIENTQYISTGHYQPVLDTDVSNTYSCEVFGGDTYVSVYGQNDFITHNTTGGFSTFEFAPEEDEAYGNGSFFVIEDKINYDWRQGVNINVVGTQPDFPAPGNNFINWTDDLDKLANPNLAIADWESRQNNHQKFLSLSSFSNLTNEWDNRVWASEAKTNGEPTDSWSDFKVNNLMDVDGNLGPINKLETFNDDVYFFQDRGFGKLIVNPTPVVQASDNISLALGTGKVLHDYGYLSTNIGTKHQWSVFISPSAIYWFDILNKKPYKYASNAGAQELSDIKGMHSFFVDKIDNNLLSIDNPANEKGIRGAYDIINNEALFTFLEPKTVYKDTSDSYNLLAPSLGGSGGLVPEGSLVEYEGTKNILDEDGNVIDTVTYYRSFDVIKSYPINGSSLIPNAYRTTEYLKERPTYLQSDFTIAFSEPMDAWSTFYEFTPTIYFNTRSRFLTPYINYKNKVYLHNVGQYNKFYGEFFNSVLEIITNEAPDKTKVFDNVSWHTNARTKAGAKGQTLDQITFDSYYCWNDYQHSGLITLDANSGTVRRVEREWQAPIPRNVVTETGSNIDVLNPLNWDLNRMFNDRIRDKYLVQHFEYDGSKSDQFIINYINTYVRTSDR